MSFKRENRYIVIKHSDAANLGVHGKTALDDICHRIDVIRADRGKKHIKSVVVEHDWPEYETVWNLIKTRVEGHSKKCLVKDCQNHTHQGKFIGDLCAPCYNALVGGRVPKVIRDPRELRTFMQSMQSGEMTVSKGLEVIDMWLAGNVIDHLVPPARDGLGEDEMPWDRIDSLTKDVLDATAERDQKDLEMKSLKERLKTHWDDAIECARLLGSTHANHRFGCFNEQDSRFVHAMHESIARRRKEVFES